MDDRDGFDRFDPRFDYKYPTSSKTSPNRKAQQKNYEGVEYIPSEKVPARTPYKSQSRAYPPAGKSGGSYGSYKARSGGAPKKKVKSQSQSQLYMVLIIAAGILFFLGACYFTYKWLSSNTSGNSGGSSGGGIVSEESYGGTERPQESREPGEELAVESDSELIGIISAISIPNGTITMVSAEDDTINDIYVNAQTQYRSKYGQPMTLSQFQEGDIVIAEYDSLNKKAQVVRADPEAWVKASIKNVEINVATTTVKISNDTYGVSKNVLFLPEGTEPSVKTSDTVTVKGRKQKILAVIVEKRTGTLEFINKERITDGTVEIDSDIYKALEETGSIKVSTGEHTIVVKGANIEVFIKEISIGEGEILTIDLGEAQMKEGVLDLSVNVPDYTLYVNEEIVARTSEPLKLPFGAYKLKVSKEGYTSWEGNVTVNQPSVSVTASLAEEVKMGRITVTTDPEYVNGSVYIDNALIGVAPQYRVSVTYGTHQLTVKAPGYVDTTHTIIVEGDSSYNVIMHPSTETAAPANTGTNVNTGGGVAEQLPNVPAEPDVIDYSNVEW